MAKQAPASLSSSLLGVPKGAAAPAEIAGEGQGVRPPVPVDEPAAPAPAAIPVPAAAPVPVATSPVPVRRPVAPPPPKEPMIALTVRLPESTQERLREMAHATRQQKQDILNQALVQFMTESGY